MVPQVSMFPMLAQVIPSMVSLLLWATYMEKGMGPSLQTQESMNSR